MARDVIERVVLERGFHRSLHFARRTDTNGVSHIHALHTNAFHQTRKVCDTLWRHLAFVGTTHGATHRATYADTRITRRFDDWRKALDAFSNRAVDILLAKGFTGRTKHHHFIGLGLESRFKAFHIRCEH